MKFCTLSIALILFFFDPSSSVAQESDSDTLKSKPYKHTSRGFVFTSPDNRYELQIAARLQFRYSSPFDQDPVTFDDFSDENSRTFKINRARLKIGGHAYQSWLRYYFEYELAQGNLLDFRVMVEKYSWLSFKVGQWKTDYNRERVISSGEQQMIERSIINRPFTLDRQQGIAIYGHLKAHGAADFNYWISLLTGTGRGARENDDTNLMYVGRLQWNPLGRSVSMSGSDFERSEKPALLIAVAAATGRSPYTRFSQAGGGELVGFDMGLPGQYRVNQAMVETAFKYNGFSWQHETHWKEVIDKVFGGTTTLIGSYLQAGYFLHESIPEIPRQLELAARYAAYRPDNELPSNHQREYSINANWFFDAGHRNKLSAEYSFIVFEDKGIELKDGSRFRFQWEISF